jgi:voltage-gated potassium channel
MKLQFWVCIFFMADLALEFIYSKRKTRYIITYFLLFIACIPYGTILPKLGITLPRDIGYFVSFMPLIRSCYALAIVVSWFAVQTSSKMFLTYVIILPPVVTASILHPIVIASITAHHKASQ